MAYIRTVKTASGVRAVQIVHSSRKGSRDIEHVGSAHTDEEYELRLAARQRLTAGQGELDLGIQSPPEAGGPLPITSSRMGHLWEGLRAAFAALGFQQATGADEVFEQLVLARIIEPTSKLDSLRVLQEAGIKAVSYPTLKRRLPRYSGKERRQQLAAACARHVDLGPSAYVLFDVTIAFAALAVSRWIEDAAGWSIKKPAGRLRSSSRPHGATAPSKSRPASRPSPPPTHYLKT